MLTSKNYRQGLLVCENEVAGISEINADEFLVYRTQVASGELIEAQSFSQLSAALDYLNNFIDQSVKLSLLDWRFEAAGCEKISRTTAAAAAPANSSESPEPSGENSCRGCDGESCH